VKRIEVRKPFLEALAKNPNLAKHNHNNPNFVGVLHEIKDGYVFGTYCGAVKYSRLTNKLDFSTMEMLEGFAPEAFTGQPEMLVLGARKNKVDQNHTDLIAYIGELNSSTLADAPLLYLPNDIRTGEKSDYNVFEAIDSSNYFVRFAKNSFLIYNRDQNSLETYSFLPPYQNFPDSTIQLLHIDNFGIVWLRTTNGVYAFDYKTKEIVDIRQHLKLTEKDVVRCLARDKQGVLWIALDNDLVRYNPNTEESFRFNKKHGFDAGGFTDRYIDKHNRDEVIIPANYGLLMFDPRQIIYHSSPPKVYISEIVIGKDTLTEMAERNFVETKQVLKYHENFITIEFASDLVYAAVGKTYEYRLIGLDSSWNKTASQNKVSYTNLKGGEYEFQVRCIDGYMNTSETLSLHFFIDKPFWLKWWFILLEIVLGFSVIFFYIKWREKNLRFAKMRLEKAVEVRTHEVTEKVIEIEHQKEIIELKNKELTDSINYAKGIQNSLLAHKDLLDANLPEYAILYKPKDIVSGDFYWAAKVNSSFYLGVCDSTGHGVPGAFMSLLNIRYLYEAVVEKKIDAPNIALDYVRMRLIENLAVDGAKDGMDGTLVKFDIEAKKMVYASAQNRPVLIRNGEVIILPADKMPIGAGYTLASFQPNQVDLQKDDVLYFFTDGYPDQFGGPKGRKLKQINLVQFLKSIHHLPMKDQLPLMEQHLAHWKGDLEQLDDILLFAFMVK
jgi:serine phosphatase RsbU (regulator of sigma subunit)